MTVVFDGFGPGVFSFFEGLAAHNDKAWFTAHKEQYEAEVKRPLVALFAELEPEFGAAKVFRIHRDVRFSHDKTPYKTSQAGIVHLGRGATRYLQVGVDGVMVGVGGPHFDAAQLLRYRAAVAGAPGERLAAVIDDLRSSGHQVGTLGPEGITADGDLKRVPSGFPADHPRADLLRYKALIAAAQVERPTWMFTPAAVAEVAERWRTMQPLADWIMAEVGDPAPRSR